MNKFTKKFKRLDTKSFILGITAVLLFCIATGASDYNADQSQTEGPFQISAGDCGCVFLIDTKTGHLWMRDELSVTDYGTPRQPIYKRIAIERQEW